MAFMEWSENMSVENVTIDMQHKQLVSMVNDVYDAMRGGKGDEAVKQIVGKLAQYTKTHFAHEEAYMQKMGYPELNEHKQVHQKLIAKVQDIQSKLANGEHISSVTLGNFLKDWLTKHIMMRDKKYAEYATATVS